MSRDVKFGLLYVGMTAALYVVLFVVMYVGRNSGFNTYPSILLPVAVLAPMFLATFFTTAMIEHRPQSLSRKEFIVFALIVVLGVALCSNLAEAHFLYANLKSAMDITFFKVLFAPLNQRYSVDVLFGLSFWASATAVAAYVAMLRIPATITARVRAAKRVDETPTTDV